MKLSHPHRYAEHMDVSCRSLGDLTRHVKFEILLENWLLFAYLRLTRVSCLLQATNPWRGDCEYESRDEALFGLPNKSACHLCGAEEIDRLSSLRTNCSHAACSVCYTITHRDTFIDGGCPVHCGGTGRISRDSPHQVPCLFEQFVEASLTSR